MQQATSYYTPKPGQKPIMMVSQPVYSDDRPSNLSLKRFRELFIQQWDSESLDLEPKDLIDRCIDGSLGDTIFCCHPNGKRRYVLHQGGRLTEYDVLGNAEFDVYWGL
ncbi:MAG: hypothetical protein KME10_03930 [Plectolyngbya sp. WJT66-NPBG17]|jgi:hypothetical protein|nr:hypothetical protein [Plectolyngbya sp. WJT66-NPBG17]MBW4527695.1 hypothetical protein [Phormidium tanganyikae FI6-MK23]